MKQMSWVWVLLAAALLNLVAAHPRHGRLPSVDELSAAPVTISAPFPFGNVAAKFNRINTMLQQ